MVSSTAGGVGIQRPSVLSWMVGAGGWDLLGASPPRFGSTADDTINTLVLFLRPAIPWKCRLVRSRDVSVLCRVLVVLLSLCVC